MAILDTQTGGVLKKKTTLNPAFTDNNLGWGSSPALSTPGQNAIQQAAKQATSTDYFKAATGDPLFQQTQGDIGADRSNFGNSRRAAIQGAVGVLGFVPEGFKDTYGDIDETTRTLAQKNTEAGTSTYARLRSAYQKAVTDSLRQNAARGVLRSGDTGYQLQQRELENRQAISDTVGKFLEYLQTGVYGPYAEALSKLNAQEREALMNVYEMIRQQGLLSGPAGGGGSPAPPAPTLDDARSAVSQVGSSIGSAFSGFKQPEPAPLPSTGLLGTIAGWQQQTQNPLAARLRSGRM